MRDSVQKNLRLTDFRFPNSEFRFSKIVAATEFPAHTRPVLTTGFTMSYLERAIADRYAKLSGDPNNDRRHCI